MEAIPLSLGMLCLQITGIEGTSIQCLESQSCQRIPITWGTCNTHRLFPLHPKILIWGLGKGPGICPHQLPTQPACRPVFGNCSSLSRHLLNTCYVGGPVLGSRGVMMNEERVHDSPALLTGKKRTPRLRVVEDRWGDRAGLASSRLLPCTAAGA